MSEHAISNARAWLENIREMAARMGSDDDEVREAAREEAQGSPLSVMVRDGWYAPGGDSDGPEEFEILLTTGGPALRIVGEVSDGGDALYPSLEWQDWGITWTKLNDLSEDDEEALREFVGVFYFGEG